MSANTGTMDSYGRGFDLDDRPGGMFRDQEKVNKQAFTYEHEERAAAGLASAAPSPDLPPSQKISVVIMGASYGRDFTQQIIEAGEYSHYITSDAGEKQHVTRGLLQINDIPVINYWLLAISKCPRLMPYTKKVHIVTNEDNHDEWVNWATTKQRSLGGFPVENLICNGTSGHDRPGTARDIATYIEKTGCQDNLLVIEADFLFEPEYNLNRIVEHFMVRGKDTVVGCPVKTYQSMGDQVVIECTPSANPKVDGMVLYDESYDRSKNPLVMAPLFVVRNSSLARVAEWAAGEECAGVHYNRQMAHLFKHLAACVPVYSLLTDFYFSVLNLEDTLFTDSFFEYYSKEKKKMFQANKVSDTDSSLDWKTEHSGSQDTKVAAQLASEAAVMEGAHHSQGALSVDWRRGTRAGPLAIANMMPAFEERYYAGVETRLQGDRDRRLPVRFTNASLIKHNPRGQHPGTSPSPGGCMGARTPTWASMYRQGSHRCTGRAHAASGAEGRVTCDAPCQC